MIHLPAAACAGFVALLLVAHARSDRRLEAVSKLSASVSFIAYGWVLGVVQGGPVGVAVFTGLVLGGIGDAFLLSKRKEYFLAGLVAFLLSHVAYVAAFLLIGVATTWALGALVLHLVIAAVVWRWLAPHTGSLRIPVAAYIAIITAMVSAAVGAAAHLDSTAGTVLIIAALAFYLSDLTVARERFVTRSLHNKLVGLPLYFGAQLLFGLGASLL